MTVLTNGGVVRGYTYWDKLLLPTRRRAHQAYHTHGQYFIMRFDANSPTQHLIQRTLRLDPRMIGFSVVKMGETLKEIAEVKGVTWDMEVKV
jgi:small subunit ribosomal protein S6